MDERPCLTWWTEMDVGSVWQSGNGEEWGGSRGWVRRVPLGRTDAEEEQEGIRGRSRRCRQCARECRWLWSRRVWSCGRGAVACRGTIEVEIINRGPAKHQPRCQVNQRLEHSRRVGARHEIELPC